MDYYISVFSLFHGSLVVEGGSNIGVPHVAFRGVIMTSTVSPMPPPAIPDSDQELPGFRLVAPLPEISLDAAELQLVLGTTVLKGLEFQGFSTETTAYQAMLQAFYRHTEAGGTLLEIGSRARSGNTYRHLAHADVRYVGVDVCDGPNVDIVGDAHHLSRVATGPYDFILSISVFEHLLMPWMVALEMNKVLRTGGVAFVQSHACFPQHEEPWDFWRFSKDAWKGLFNGHTGFRVLDSGHAMPCFVTERYLSAGTRGADLVPSYILSGCLVQKTGPARVSWSAEAAEVADLQYSHA